MTVTATHLDLPNLRARAAQLTNRMGGTAVFGPEAVARQWRCLSRLNLHCTHRKLLVSAAFQAMRELVGELVAADDIDPRRVPFIVQQAAGFVSRVSTEPPVPRPHGVPSVVITDGYRSTDSTEWLARADQDVVRPTVAGYVVLAATAFHRRRHFMEEWSVQQYFGPDAGGAGDDLLGQLQRLPRVVVMADGLTPLYDDLAPAAVVRPDPDIAGSVNPYMVTFCPRVAARLGWRSDPRHVFTYLGTNDQVVARTLYWRDGVVSSHPTDTAVFRYGYVLMVREDRTDDIRPYVATNQVSRAWRVMLKNGEETRVVNRASRVEATPGSSSGQYLHVLTS